jgi:hypothetical protein
MASLWTPDGEHRVAKDTPPPAAKDEAPPATETSAKSATEASAKGTDEAELDALQAELLAIPVEDVVANHCYGLFQLAALYLGQRPPRLVDAKVAIDGLGGIVDVLGERLGPGAETLVEGLAQIRLAYVQIAGAQVASDDQAGAERNGAGDTTPSGPPAS